MNKIKIEDLKPGMKFSHAVYITPTNMLVGPEIAVKEKDLERLKKWGIAEVETSGEILNEVDYSFKEEEEEKDESHLQSDLIQEYKALHKIKDKFKNYYEDTVTDINTILTDIKNDKSLNNMKIFNIATDLISEVINNSHIFIFFASKMSKEDDYLAYHLLNTAIFSIIIGHLIKMDSKKLINLAAGSLIFDIGMARIPQAIVRKKEKLSSKELSIIKLHTIYGYKLLIKDSNLPSEIASIALQHHEQFDGAGYPRKLKEDQIDLFSRIVSIADSFEAMTKKRSYRNEFMSYEAMQNILNQSKNKFDPKLIRIFLSNMSIYPVTSLVKLNTNAIGMVIGTHGDIPLRPVIKIVIDEFGDKIPEDENRFVDLLKVQDLFIVSAVDEVDINMNIFDLI